jgi:hypothetical protein
MNYKVKHFIESITGIPDKVKCFYQRGKRGWSDEDWWNLDSYLCTLLPQMLRRLKEKAHGHPCHEEITSFEHWQEILEQMAQGFEAGNRIISDEYYKLTPEYHKRLEEASMDLDRLPHATPEELAIMREAEQKDEALFHEAIRLLDKYYFGLWD